MPGGRGHDGLRLPTRAARHGLLFTSEGRFRSSRRGMRRTRGRWIRLANAGFASGIRGRICVIFMRRMSCWRRF